jgi:radical SAM superfamily enzyme YgiQ (UPF0313 family)
MKLVFYLDYDKFERREAPAILPFIQVLRDKGNHVKFASSEGELLETVEKGYDAVAISVFSTLELKQALRAAVKVKKANPRIVTILGGQGVVGNAEKLINALGVDIVVEGEGEWVLPLLLEHLKLEDLETENLVEAFSEEELVLSDRERDYFGKELQLLLGEHVFYRSPISSKVGEKMINACFTRKTRVNGRTITLPVPISRVLIKTHGGAVLKAEPDYRGIYAGEEERWGEGYPLSYEDFLRLSRPYPTEEELNELTQEYPWDIVEAKGWSALSLYAQRGCNWGRCSYCGISTPYGRRLAPSKVVEWLKEARKRGITQATFEDDQFLQSKKWVEELCDLIVREGLSGDFQFGAMVRVEAVKSREVLAKLREANFVKLQIGVESLIPEKIRYFRKTRPGDEEGYVRKAVRLIENCFELGIQPGVFMITTRPKARGALVEVAEELRRVSEIILSSYEKFSRLPTVSFNDMLMAYPGAPLLEKETYKRILIPLGPRRMEDRVVLLTMEIPYIFEFKSIDLANFIGNLFAISKKRGAPPEVVNESLEHLEDLVEALELSARQLVSEIGIALRVIEASDKSVEEKTMMISRVLRGIAKPEAFFNDVDMAAYRKAAENEKQRILEACGEVKKNLIAVEEPVIREVNSHLMASRKKLKALELAANKSKVRRELEGLRSSTEQLLLRTYSFLRARNTLEALLDFIDEFEKARG